MDPIKPFMAQSTLVFFQPNENFWAFLAKTPWRYKQFHDIGAGIGCLTRQMREKGYDVLAYDLYEKKHPCVPDIKIIDVTKTYFKVESLDCLIIARPCHSGFVEDVLAKYLNNGDALYISKPENVPTDIGNFHHEIVAYDVGAEHENVYRIWAYNPEAVVFRYLGGSASGWWEYDPERNRYTNGGMGGFYGKDSDIVLKEQKAAHFEMFYEDVKPETCQPNSKVGWLAPDGTFWGCDESGHSHTARVIIGTSEKRLEQKNWCKLRGRYHGRMFYSLGECTFDFSENRPRVTPEQAKVLRAKGYHIENFELPLSDPAFEIASEAPRLTVPEGYED